MEVIVGRAVKRKDCARREQEPAARLQDAVELGRERMRVGYVLEKTGADDRPEA